MSNLGRRVLLVIVVAMLVIACGPDAPSSPSPSPSASLPPSPAPSLVTTPDDAWAAVVAHEPRFDGIDPKDPSLLGQAAWYEVQAASGVGAFVVTITVGWGDCQAGCIDHHTWLIAVRPDGTTTTISDQGSAVPGGILPIGGTTGRTGVTGSATAGPVCPVDTVPPDPKCAPRPVAKAPVSALDSNGAVVGTTTTGADGTFAFDLPAGDYTIVGGAVEGVMGAPAPVSATVTAGRVTQVDLGYDTGIR